jgi:hypothetical protein
VTPKNLVIEGGTNAYTNLRYALREQRTKAGVGVFFWAKGEAGYGGITSAARAP